MIKEKLKTAEETLKAKLQALPNASEDDWDTAIKENPEAHNAIIEAMEAYASQFRQSEIKVPSEEEIIKAGIKNSYHYAKEFKICSKNAFWDGFQWACDEIIKRNR